MHSSQISKLVLLLIHIDCSTTLILTIYSFGRSHHPLSTLQDKVLSYGGRINQSLSTLVSS